MGNFRIVQSSLADYFRMIQAEVHELTEPIGLSDTPPSEKPNPKTGSQYSCAAPDTPTTTSAK